MFRRYGATTGLTGSVCSGSCPSGKYSAAGSSACTDCSIGKVSVAGVGACTPAVGAPTPDPTHVPTPVPSPLPGLAFGGAVELVMGEGALGALGVASSVSAADKLRRGDHGSRGDLFGASVAGLGSLVRTNGMPRRGSKGVEAIAIGAPGREGGMGAVFIVR